MPKRTWMILALVLAAVLLNVPADVFGAQPRIEQIDESARKVYLKRLQMRRELFVFVLETPATQP